ncbi:MAG TPA: hypothetical protein VHP32_10910 [Ignavibacteria bacterium]|nr:hypothetical protein [Ignavibacteria bacterium]
MANYFIFRCSDKTYGECLRRNLFGQTTNMKDYVKQVKKSDILFLHNVQKQIIEGPFFAKSDGMYNIIPDAWEGKFPQQVQVETRGKTSKIKKASFDKFG